MARVLFSSIPALIFVGFAIRAALGGRVENAVVFMVLSGLTLVFPICFLGIIFIKRLARRFEG